MKIMKEVGQWGSKVAKKSWEASKAAPGQVKAKSLDTFSKIHRSEAYRKASDAMNSMKFVTVKEIGEKLGTKTGIGIMAGTGGAAAGYAAGKKKKKNKRYG
tara:strand:+ start:905 stop:1207 length:303 start_codon:yes stop_codon:yes gene_type:complete